MREDEKFSIFPKRFEKYKIGYFLLWRKRSPGFIKDTKKKFKFFIIYTTKDLILAFRVGKYSEVKDIIRKLEKIYGFEWSGETLIYKTVKDH